MLCGSRLKLSIQNDHGQATVAALIILPLALAISIAFLILAQALEIEAKTTAACRLSLVESQAKAAHALEELVKLNYWATIARRVEKGADAVDTVTSKIPIPHGFVIGKLLKLGSFGIQATVIAFQTYWKVIGMKSVLAPEAAALAMQEALPKGMSRTIIEGLFGSFDLTTLKSLGKTKYAHPKFHLIATPAKSRTPDYNPAPDFEKTQTARVRILLRTASNEDDASSRSLSKLAGFRKAFSPKIEFGCAVTLVKKGRNKWGPQIIEDRLLSN